MPRRWEAHNNRLFLRVAPEYHQVKVLDWRSVATARPAWLYHDEIHLKPAGGAGYAAWLLMNVRH